MSSKQDQEKGKWYKKWKFWAFVGYALVIFVICLCLFVSVKEIPIWNLIPDSAFAFVSINITDDSEGIASLLNGLESWILEEEKSRVKGIVIKKAFSSFFPERIIMIASAGKEAKPEHIVIVRMSGVIRLAKLFPGQIERAVFKGQDIKLI